MTGAEIAPLFTSLATLIASVTGLLVSLRNSKKIQEVHTATNGKMEELVNEVRAASFAKGVKSAKDEDVSSNTIL